MARKHSEIGPCSTCRHWLPLFTGEDWGVRSFVDAPAEAQAEITQRLEQQMKADGYADAFDALAEKVPESLLRYDTEIPGGTDWPYWGECAPTQLDSEASKTSLARAMDGSMYHAVLRCRCNFGCVQWEAFEPLQSLAR